jgi:phosphomannomutase
MQLAPSIFKAYDIRGVVPSTVDEAVAEGIGRAFGTIARRRARPPWRLAATDA